MTGVALMVIVQWTASDLCVGVFLGTDHVDRKNQFSGCERNCWEEWCRDAKENIVYL